MWDIIVALFWFGLIITMGMFIFQVVLGFLGMIFVGFMATIVWVFEKLTGKEK